MSARRTLFRVVSLDEGAEAIALGGFTIGPNAIRAKQFWTSLQDAQWFMHRLDRIAGGPNRIVEVLMSDTASPLLSEIPLDSRVAVSISEDDLISFNACVLQVRVVAA